MKRLKLLNRQITTAYTHLLLINHLQNNKVKNLFIYLVYQNIY